MPFTGKVIRCTSMLIPLSNSARLIACPTLDSILKYLSYKLVTSSMIDLSVGLKSKQDTPISQYPFIFSERDLSVSTPSAVAYLLANMLFCGIKKFDNTPRNKLCNKNFKHFQKQSNKSFGYHEICPICISQNIVVFTKYEHRNGSSMSLLTTSLRNIFRSL